MGNDLSGFEHNVLGLSQQEIKALDIASSAIGTISSLWGYANTAKSVLLALGVLSEANQLVEMQKAIDQLWLEFEAVFQASEAETAMRDIANQLSYARNALQTLTESAPNDASTAGIDQNWDELRPFVLTDSSRVVIALGSEAYWRRIFFAELQYKRWSPGETHPSPAVSSGLVFDYRLALPAYLEAISIRLTILVAVLKDYQDHARQELVAMARTLEAYHNKIRDGISQVLWEPYFNFDDQDPYMGGQPGVPLWLREGALVGFVEIYSTWDRVESWPNEYPRRAARSGPAEEGRWQQFLVRYAVRNWVRWKAVYNGIGLGPTARAIVLLKEMAKVSPATIDGPGGDYSIKELARAIHDGRQVWPILDDHHGNLVDPISLLELLHLLQTYRSKPYTSIREALAQ